MNMVILYCRYGGEKCNIMDFESLGSLLDYRSKTPIHFHNLVGCLTLSMKNAYVFISAPKQDRMKYM